MRIALSTIGTAGDIIPFARLARALLARGHAVTVCAWDDVASWFPSGVRFVAAGGAIGAPEAEGIFDAALREDDPQRQKWHFCRLFYGLGDGLARARAAYLRALEALSGHDVALINVLDHAAQVAADELGIRWAAYSSRPPADRTAADELNAEIDAAISTLLAEASGRPVRIRAFREGSPLPGLAACSAHLAPTADPRVVLTGAWLEPSRPEPLPEEVEAHLAGGPTLFATFGTMPDSRGRSTALIAAARRSGWRALVQVLPPAVAPVTVGDGVLVWRDRLPFAALLPRVAAVVHHGSVGTTHEAVRAARPSLVIPHMGDQFFWGLTLHERGLGPPPIRFDELEPGLVSARMLALRDRRCQARLDALSTALAAEDGVAVAVAQLEAASRC